MKIYQSAAELIGNTPLVQLNGYMVQHKLPITLWGKCEYFNPAGSVKDRIGYAMIVDAEARGLLAKGGIIIEPTSGNTGIGLATICAQRGYRLILTMPETMSAERRALLAAYGAEIVLTPAAEGMTGAINKANELAASLSGAFIPSQFSNPANSECHKKTTGPEIWRDTAGEVEVFVAGIGSGGTITGVGEYLKNQKPSVKIVAVEPADSPLLSQGRAGAHGLQGIGANFVPQVLNRDIIDEVVTVSTEEAFAAARDLAKKDGILVGISAGAAVAACAKLAQRAEYSGKNIVVLLPDSGERYLSTDLF